MQKERMNEKKKERKQASALPKTHKAPSRAPWEGGPIARGRGVPFASPLPSTTRDAARHQLDPPRQLRRLRRGRRRRPPLSRPQKTGKGRREIEGEKRHENKHKRTRTQLYRNENGRNRNNEEEGWKRRKEKRRREYIFQK